MENEKVINNIRGLALDMINNAGSGHPGVVLSATPILYTLYAKHLRFNIDDDKYFNRDRFILSCGHASALLYATLYMAGFDITLDDLKDFRKIDSKTPGHPELGKTPGVDMTTGPLGQGFATAVGIAMAERKLENDFPNGLFDYYTYVLVSDGDLMEGISYEAASLAGTQRLNKLIVLYDSNNNSLDHSTDITFTEDVKSRFKAQNWDVFEVKNGEDVESIDEAINEAKRSSKPSLIIVNTVLGKYSKFENSNLSHAMQLDDDEITVIKNKLNVRDIAFSVSTEAIETFREQVSLRCSNITQNDEAIINNLTEGQKEYFSYLVINDKSIRNISFNEDIDEEEAPRDTSSKILNRLATDNPYIIGGAADVFLSTKTYINDQGDFTYENRDGKNIFFGVREHLMGAVANGLALCGFRPYVATFTTFSDYLRPAIRLAAMMKLPVVYILTHDSISIGADGPTHQPIEQLESLRIIPNVEVFRPADANEVIGSYKVIYEKKDSPAVIALSKNKLKVLRNAKINEVVNGAYILNDDGRALNGVLISSGEDVHLSIEVANRLQKKGLNLRVVSVPCIRRLMELPDKKYDEILPVEKKKIVISTEISGSWNEIIYNPDCLITMSTFGASGSKEDIYKKFGYDIDTLEKKVEELIK